MNTQVLGDPFAQFGNQASDFLGSDSTRIAASMAGTLINKGVTDLYVNLRF